MPKQYLNLSRNVLLGFALILMVNSVSAQGFYNKNAWKRHKHELNFSLGVSNFLGEVGGRDQIGTNFVWDLEFSKTNFGAGFNYQYYVANNVALRFSFLYGKVSGDDALTQERFRNNRNISFQSTILEGGFGFEWQFLKEKIGNIYNLKSKTGKKLGMKSFNMGFYVTSGISGFYYNPKSKDANGNLVELRPLRTEGQGLPGGAEEYGKFGLAIPVGFGLRRSINRTMGLKLELTHRFTFTDYIDDASTVYYDPAILQQEVGPQAVYFANPTNGSIATYTSGTYVYDPTKPGSQRGDPNDNDGYMFLMASFYMKLETKQQAYGRNRVRRVKASF